MVKARREIRHGFLDYAEATKSNLQSAVTEYLKTGYDVHIDSVEVELNAILQRDASQSLEKQGLVDRINSVTDFLHEVREKTPWR